MVEMFVNDGAKSFGGESTHARLNELRTLKFNDDSLNTRAAFSVHPREPTF
jgi:hypothetical protein